VMTISWSAKNKIEMMWDIMMFTNWYI